MKSVRFSWLSIASTQGDPMYPNHRANTQVNREILDLSGTEATVRIL